MTLRRQVSFVVPEKASQVLFKIAEHDPLDLLVVVRQQLEKYVLENERVALAFAVDADDLVQTLCDLHADGDVFVCRELLDDSDEVDVFVVEDVVEAGQVESHVALDLGALEVEQFI